MFGVVPDVHLRIIKQIPVRPQGNTEDRMIKKADGRGENMHQKKVLNAKGNPGQRDIFQGAVDHRFHSVKPQVRGKAHLLDRVMYLMKLPQKFRTLQQPVYVPSDKIAH
jgi:hypothetical protein